MNQDSDYEEHDSFTEIIADRPSTRGVSIDYSQLADEESSDSGAEVEGESEEIVATDSSQSPKITNKARKKIKLRSFVWEHMERVQENERYYVRCKIQDCQSPDIIYDKGNGSTNRLIVHLERLHGIVNPKRSTKEPTECNHISVSQALVELVVNEDLPFSIVKSPWFQRFCQEIRNQKDIPTSCPDTLKTQIESQYGVLKERLKSDMKRASSVALSLDCWTSVNKIAFLCIVGHWIDDNWEKREMVLEFVELEGEHTGENLAAEVLKCLKEQDIIHKFICITGDNASNNTAMDKELSCCEELKDSKYCGQRMCEDGYQCNYNYVSCFAHVLNIVVQDFLKELKSGTIDEARALCERNNIANSVTLTPVQKVRTLAIFISRSPQRINVEWKE